ncbi:MAG: integrase arm-type DNA-binding domain-containing protein [Roseiarcus sp.]|jgi:integrase
MPLTQFDLKNAKPAETAYKLSDGGGLHLLVKPNGARLWRMKYRFLGKEQLLSFGAYPLFSLAEARAKRDEAKKLIASGVDPSVKKKGDRLDAQRAAANTFGLIAGEFVANLEANGAATPTLNKNKWLLEEVAAPLASRPIADITPAELLDLLKRIERSGRRETARRLRATISAVFRLAIVTLRATTDPTSALKGALLRPQVQHRAAITDEKKLGGLLRSLDEFDGWPTLRAAMLFTALSCARPGEVRGARRAEFDFEKTIWRIPEERTKMRRPHDVPLSRQSVAVLKEIWPMSDYGDLVFPSIRSSKKMLSENAMNSALRRLGYTQDEMTSHGFRSTASTILNERGIRPDVIEAVLGHQSENVVRRAYNRATYWPERVALMQEWADMLDEFRALDPPDTRLAVNAIAT